MCKYINVCTTHTADEYINKYKDAAIVEMKRSMPASITLAQGLLENGNSDLLQRSKSVSNVNQTEGRICKAWMMP
jgi:flagellum-specific peptidoglycan hydrolase FlgJ